VYRPVVRAERPFCSRSRRASARTDVAVWQILAALAPNFGTVIVARFLGGISSAGGSVTLGMGESCESEMKQH
jgi:hypothetical protein